MCASEPPRAVTASRLLAAGGTRRAIDEALHAGEIDRLRRGVYAYRDACDPVRTAARHGGTLACESAARHLGIWVVPTASSAPHVWMRGHGHRRCPTTNGERCDCVEHWDDGPAEDSFALPSVPRVLRQLLQCHGVEAFFVAVESALALGLLDAGGLCWLRRTTNAPARAAIAFARRDAGSGLESLLRWRLRGRGLRLRCQVAVYGVGTVDLLIGDRLIVELDGAEFHSGESERHRDLVRDAHAATWGYVTLRFDYALVVHDWEAVIAAVMAHVEAGLHLR